MTLTTELNQAMTFSQEDIRLMKETICKGATDADFKLFLMICERTRLDPFAKQLYAVMRWDSKLGRNSMTVQSSIDGLRLVAERTGKYAPGRATTYEYTNDGKILSATAYVKKQTSDGTWHEVAYTAFFDEYCQKTKDSTPTKFWRDMAHVMLAKVAEAACLRRCFPMELAGLYTSDEMEQAKTIDAEVTNIPEETINIKDIEAKLAKIFETFPEEDHVKLTEYIEKWKEAHGKTTVDLIRRFENIEELKTNFNKWMKR